MHKWKKRHISTLIVIHYTILHITSILNSLFNWDGTRPLWKSTFNLFSRSAFSIDAGSAWHAHSILFSNMTKALPPLTLPSYKYDGSESIQCADLTQLTKQFYNRFVIPESKLCKGPNEKKSKNPQGTTRAHVPLSSNKIYHSHPIDHPKLADISASPPFFPAVFCTLHSTSLSDNSTVNFFSSLLFFHIPSSNAFHRPKLSTSHKARDTQSTNHSAMSHIKKVFPLKYVEKIRYHNKKPLWARIT